MPQYSWFHFSKQINSQLLLHKHNTTETYIHTAVYSPVGKRLYCFGKVLIHRSAFVAMVVVWCLAVRFGCLLGPDRWWRLGVGGEWIGYFLFVCFSNILIATAGVFFLLYPYRFLRCLVRFYDLVSSHVCYHCTQHSIHGCSSLGWLPVGFCGKARRQWNYYSDC